MGDAKFSIIDVGGLGELSKPISDLVAIFDRRFVQPGAIRANAQAQADAYRIEQTNRTEVDIYNQELLRRAAHRTANNLIREQQNIESVVRKSLADVEPTAKPNEIDPDWTSLFTKAVGDISSEEIQVIWAKILSGEANKPGSFSKRTLKIMSDLSKEEAQLFSTLCGFSINHGPVIFDLRDKIYTENGLNFDGVLMLANAGLIDLIDAGAYTRENFPQIVFLKYFERDIYMTDCGNQLVVGQIRFTRSGSEIATICGGKPIEGFFDWLLKRWYPLGAFEPVFGTKENPCLDKRMIKSDGTEIISPFPLEAFKKFGESIGFKPPHAY